MLEYARIARQENKHTTMQECLLHIHRYTYTYIGAYAHKMHRCTCLGRGRRGFPGLASSSRPNPGSHGLGLCLQCLKLRKHSTLINRCKHQVFHRDRNSDKLLRDKKKRVPAQAGAGLELGAHWTSTPARFANASFVMGRS